METNTKTPQEQAEEVRRSFAKRKRECVEIAIKLKTSVEILEEILKFDDIDEVNANGLGKVNMHDYIWNILIWYPKQSVPFLVSHMLPLYNQANTTMQQPCRFIVWLSRLVPDAKLFNLLLKPFPKSAVGDILRIRSIEKVIEQLKRLDYLLTNEEEIDGEIVNVQVIARMVSYLHVILPRKTSEIVRFTLDLYKECQKVNARQIKGFSNFSKQK